MPVPVVMPRLGWTMEEGAIVEWLKRAGDDVQAGEPLFQIESDKAVHECEALDSGLLYIPADSPMPGVAVPIGTVLAYLLAPGEPPPTGAPRFVAPEAPAAAPQPAEPDDGAVAAGAPGGPISPRASRVAGELGVEFGGLAGSGRSGRIVERDVRAAAAALPVDRPARVSPLAQRMAADAGVDAAVVAAGQPGERVTAADVVRATAVPHTSPPAPVVPAGHSVPFAGTRRVIANRLLAAARETIPVTLTTEADATNLVALRAAAREDGRADPPTLSDLFVALTARALLDHPALNAALVDDQIVRHAHVNIGLAVDTDRGLIVPVVQDAALLSMRRLAAETARLVAAARANALAPADVAGGTFTVSNLGMFEVDVFTPVINPPECAILGVGRIVSRPVVVDEATGAIAARKMVALSLTFDHRLVDGGPAARFLQHVKRFVEQPTRWLLG